MGNRVFILFFLIAVFSFLFSAVSAVLLFIRKKYGLSCGGILWVIFFISVSVPIVHEQSLIELQLFTNYTGGMRIEVQDDGVILCDDIYIPKQTLDAARNICGLVWAGWIINMTAHLSYGIAGYWNNLHFLTKHSSECHDDRINVIFNRAKKKAGIRRQISLRVMKKDIRLSPCTCGINFPAVYIGKEYLYDYSELRLELVFLHELMHIKHHDTLLKLAALFITSCFSFLPAARKIKNAIGEDVEFRCDDAVLAEMGDDVRGEYIAMIIDVAERNLRDDCSGADFLSSVSRSGEMILNRYKYMKERRSRKSRAVYAFSALVVALTVNMALVSAVSVKNIDNLGVDFANPLVERAVCEYLGVADPHSLTEQDISEIYSLEFALSDSRLLLGNDIPEKYAISCTLNEGLLRTGSGYFPPVRENDDLKFTHDIIPFMIRTELFDIVLPDEAENSGMRELYHPDNLVMLLGNYDSEKLKEYLLDEYSKGNLQPFLSNKRTVDTRDIVLFTGLRTLIFSDRLQPSDASVGLSENYAVIYRDD